jgi:cytochrome P450
MPAIRLAADDDLLGPEAMDDPYALFGRLRDETPIVWSERYSAWILTRHSDVDWLTRNHELFSSAVAVNDPGGTYPSLNQPDPELRAALMPIYTAAFEQIDRPQHLVMRQAIHRWFTPSAVEQRRADIRRAVTELLEEKAPEGRVEVRSELATPLPLMVICRMLGLPISDAPLMRRLTEAAFGKGGYEDEGGRGVIRGFRELEEYFEPVIEERRASPGDGDLISLLLEGERQGAYMPEQIFPNVLLLMAAGHHTTINLICNGVLAFARHPEQWELLRGDPEGLSRSATEECLRYDPPFKMFWRICTRDVEHDGFTFRAGQRVFWAIVSANRDPLVFDDPETFDIRRSPNPHLSFGAGIHHCLGAALARLEGQEVFQAMAERLPTLRLETDRVDYEPDWQSRSMRALPVSWS